MKRQHINRREVRMLIQKYQQGGCTPEEEAIVEEWLAEMEERPTVLSDDQIERARRHTLQTLISRLSVERSPEVVLRKPFRRYLPYAAAILIMTFLGLYLAEAPRYAANDMVNAEDIMPKGEHAVLTLANGSTIPLDPSQGGISMEAGIKYSSGADVAPYPLDDNAVRSLKYILSTPKGSTYQVILADGTKVRLNASSTLTYPKRFSGSFREVEVQGEAYFEVTSVKGGNNQLVPFVVKSRGQSITVLGTSFNVRSYADEEAVKTTLIEGRVQVSGDGNEKIILDPGEESIYTAYSLSKREANLYSATAWKDGRFNFEGQNLQTVMKELARWYDLEIVYEGKVPELEFFGGVYRNNDLATVLKILESSDVGYRMEAGPKLVITSLKKQIKR